MLRFTSQYTANGAQNTNVINASFYKHRCIVLSTRHVFKVTKLHHLHLVHEHATMHQHQMTEQEHATADAITERVLVEMGHMPRTANPFVKQFMNVLPQAVTRFTKPVQNGFNQMVAHPVQGAVRQVTQPVQQVVNQGVYDATQKVNGVVQGVQQAIKQPYRPPTRRAQSSPWWKIPGSNVQRIR